MKTATATSRRTFASTAPTSASRSRSEYRATVLSGDEHGETVVNFSPGIKFVPAGDKNLQIGLGLGFPLSDSKEFDARLLLSLFYHF